MARLIPFLLLVLMFGHGCSSNSRGRGSSGGTPDTGVPVDSALADSGQGAADTGPPRDAAADTRPPDTGTGQPDSSAGDSAYEPCSGASDCFSPTSLCAELAINTGSGIVMDMMCTRECGADDECPAPGRCFMLGARSLCVEVCASVADCPAGWACVDGAMTGFPAAVCLPS